MLVVLLAGSGDGGNEGKERWAWKGVWSKKMLRGSFAELKSETTYRFLTIRQKDNVYIACKPCISG